MGAQGDGRGKDGVARQRRWRPATSRKASASRHAPSHLRSPSPSPYTPHTMRRTSRTCPRSELCCRRGDRACRPKSRRRGAGRWKWSPCRHWPQGSEIGPQGCATTLHGPSRATQPARGHLRDTSATACAELRAQLVNSTPTPLSTSLRVAWPRYCCGARPTLRFERLCQRSSGHAFFPSGPASRWAYRLRSHTSSGIVVPSSVSQTIVNEP